MKIALCGVTFLFGDEKSNKKTPSYGKIENGTFSLNIDMLIPIIRVLNIKMTLNDKKN